MHTQTWREGISPRISETTPGVTTILGNSLVFSLNYYRIKEGGIRLWHSSCIPKGFATQIAHCCMEVSYTTGFCTSGENRCAKDDPFFGRRRSFGQIVREKEMLLEGEEKCIEAIERKKRIQSSILYVLTDRGTNRPPCSVCVLLSVSLGAQELTSLQGGGGGGPSLSKRGDGVASRV